MTVRSTINLKRCASSTSSRHNNAEACSEPSQTSKLELFAKILNGWKPLTIIAKSSILGVRLSSTYASGTAIFPLLLQTIQLINGPNRKTKLQPEIKFLLSLYYKREDFRHFAQNLPLVWALRSKHYESVHLKNWWNITNKQPQTKFTGS